MAQERTHSQRTRSVAPSIFDENEPSSDAFHSATPSSLNSSLRNTRASARQAAATDLAPPSAATPSQPAPPTRPSRKRKAAEREPSPPPQPEPAKPSKSKRHQKRQKTTEQEPAVAQAPVPTRQRKGKSTAAMSSPGASGGPANEQGSAASSATRKSNRNKKSNQDLAAAAAATPTAPRKSKKQTKHAEAETDPNEGDDVEPGDEDDDEEDDSDDNDNDDLPRGFNEEDEDDDPFGGFGGPGGPPHGLSNTLRALSGMMSGVSSRLREILSNLKQKEDPSMQLIALQELSEILLVSTEDNLSGHFSPDAFVKELVTLMQPSDFGEENPEMMLLACRCIANLMEALPASTANVVYGGAVPILCQKLLEIHYIDLAEQALSTLEKISVEYPASIVREGGLTACLTYLDFFATSTQRTAVTTAANCCRNIPEDSFPVIRDVMPILLNVLSSNDQKVVEQGSLCVSRVVESFKYQPAKLEELVSSDLLKAILRLLLPGTTNLIGPSIHTQFLRVLAFTAKASPTLSAELFKMNVVETLYQILTGVSPPNGVHDVASKLDSVVIMQALIHRPREQVIETLNVICELLPGVPQDLPSFMDNAFENAISSEPSSTSSRKKSLNEKRIELLEGCKEELKRFAVILFPTLTDAFSSTVNLSVRQKVLTAQLKMLSTLDRDIIMEALRTLPYASFLAAILSQQDHPTLVNSALQAAELLLTRLDDVYRYQFYREGVITEITKLAQSAEPTEPVEEEDKQPESSDATGNDAAEATAVVADNATGESAVANDRDEEDNSSDGDNDDENDVDMDDAQDDRSVSNGSSRTSSVSLDGQRPSLPAGVTTMQQLIAQRAKKFLEVHENEKNSKIMKKKAMKILSNLQDLAVKIEDFYLRQQSGNGVELFDQLAAYFDGDVLESVTSAELLNSEVVRVLLEVFNNPDEELANDARSAFLEVFMGRTVNKKPKTATADSPATPFSVLIHKLQDLLSRTEHFEVVTVHQNTFDGNRSSAASMLAKQIRLKLVADDDSDIPRAYRNIMVSIHAIATFKALDDYLRPRISISERSRSSRHRDGLSGALAALAAAGMANPYGPPSAASRLAERQFAAAMAGHAAPPPPPPSAPRSSRRHKSKTAPTATPASATQSTTETPQEKTARRSSRRRQAQSDQIPPPPPPPRQDDDSLQGALECADERMLSEDDDMDDSAALDAIVGELNEEMEEDNGEDPGAVNLEVAVGGKITARKEDGTKVATPAQAPSGSAATPGATSAPPAASAPPSAATPTQSNRPMSYAAAIQATPQDWHIEFSLDDKPISNEVTIYRAVHSTTGHIDEQTSRNVWSGVHAIKFKRVAGPPPAEPSSFTQANEAAETTASGIPASLDKHPATSSILRLLNILHALNANIDDVLAENKDTLKLNVEPLSQFVNTKLTAKLNRQLEEPLIVASNCLPSWSEDLAHLYPFLFPFETRHLFLQSTSFGYARSMTRWQNAQSADESRRDRHRDERPFLGRLQRQKVRISRSKILESALKVMELYGASQSMLEVEYFDEVGTGLGPTLEFYSTVSKEFSKKKLKLWRETEGNDNDEYAFGLRGLFPAPMSEEQARHENGKKVLHLFKMLGKFVARSMIDSRIIDVSFNPTFFRIGDESTTVTPSLGAVKTVDAQLAASLMLIKKFVVAKKAVDENGSLTAADKVAAAQNILVAGVRIDELGLDFTMPGYSSIELIHNGAHTAVTIDNVDLYLEKVIDMTLGSGVQRQVDAFRTGFTQVFPYSALSAFTPNELVMLFGRVDEDWSLETLMDSIKADHGFNMDSKSVKNLLQTMSELSATQRRDFLQFTTGSPKLPIGGFKNLTPLFTVVCKPSEPPYTSDDYLPSVMTCVNYLKLPDYTDLEVMKRRMDTAIKEGQGAFHLS